MKCIVKIRGLSREGKDELIGKIILEGGTYTLSPPTETALQNILGARIKAPDGRFLTSKDKRAFMSALQFQYKSAYLRAEAPEFKE